MMISIETLLGMIHTDVLEQEAIDRENVFYGNDGLERYLPNIDYRLELLVDEDGNYEWTE